MVEDDGMKEMFRKLNKDGSITNILQQEIAKNLLKDKVTNIEKIAPDFISTGNIGCMTQISSGTNIPIVHTVEIIDWLTGGPKPYKLKNL